MTGPRAFTKTYPSALASARAAAHHAWLTRHAGPLRQPAIRAVRQHLIDFDFIEGRHATAEDLPVLAAMLAQSHAAAWVSDLHRARLDTPHPLDGSGPHALADFLSPRLAALQGRRRTGHLPQATATAAERLLRSAATGSAAFYKDTNPRNILITASGRPVVVDVDDVTLAPFGYDLAKLIVTLAMTYGLLPTSAVTSALAAYNDTLRSHSHQLAGVPLVQLLAYADLHHVFTVPYLGRGGYRYPWPQVRPDLPLPTPEVSS
ncbi:phosphotransferase [Planotetraspora mira]|uniref:Aminoglycoside phosphotransferase domain-containing protein n=1 Tax=Planotetraspora mira TaxID=58121 RepID=A0A8J3XBI8_9ACTN|nr:phosphotransferase [Planotetraspora mira]GII34626.1 hypothetical protein Pmi06nite_80680 [Planotetraspora mira]